MVSIPRPLRPDETVRTPGGRQNLRSPGQVRVQATQTVTQPGPGRIGRHVGQAAGSRGIAGQAARCCGTFCQGGTFDLGGSRPACGPAADRGGETPTTVAGTRV